MKMRLSAKVVLVAGGTGGLGRAVSLAFVEEGAKVVVTCREQKEFDALKREAGANGSSIEGHRVDVTDEIAVRQLVDRVLTEHGRLDALVNTVGGYAGGVNLWELETKVFDQMLALNLRSGYVLSRAAIPAMLKQKHGAIVKRCLKSCVGSRRRRIRLCRFKGRSGGPDGVVGRRSKGQRGAGELHSSQHHRHRGKSQSNAQRRFFEMAQAPGDRACHPVLMQRRRQSNSRCSRTGLWGQRS